MANRRPSQTGMRPIQSIPPSNRKFRTPRQLLLLGRDADSRLR
jgi:hypothetical protein